jgi:hypothetical protein
LHVGTSVNAPDIFQGGTRVAEEISLVTTGAGLTKTGTVLSVDAAQPGITSLGTLTSLSVSGNVPASSVPADGFHLANKWYVDTLGISLQVQG